MHKYKVEIPNLLSVLDCYDEFEKNLANHKFIIKSLIGKLNDQEEIVSRIEKEREFEIEKFDKLLYNWKSLINNDELVEKASQVN